MERMSERTEEAAQAAPRSDTRAAIVGEFNPGPVQRARVVLWVECDKPFDPSRTAKHIEAAQASGRELRVRRRCEDDHRMAGLAAQPHHQGRVCRIGDATGGGPADLPARAAKAGTAPRVDMPTPPCVSSANGVAHFEFAARPFIREVARPVAVMIASGRKELVEALMARWAGEPGIGVLGDPVGDPAHLLKYLAQRQPGVLLLDKPLFEKIGAESVRMIAATAPGARVLLLCDALNAGLVETVLRHRFHGALLSSGSPEASVKAIRAVSRGEIWLPRTLLAHALSDRLLAPTPGDEAAQAARSLDDAEDDLTPREAQVVAHLRDGFTNKEIARRLGVVEDTVKKHLQSVFAKLGVHRRALVVLRPSGAPTNLA